MWVVEAVWVTVRGRGGCGWWRRCGWPQAGEGGVGGEGGVVGENGEGAGGGSGHALAAFQDTEKVEEC